GGAARTSAAEHQADVGGDAIDPRAELRAAAERREVAIDLQKGFLHDVRRIGFARQATRETKDAVLVAHDERFEGSIVASRGSRHERVPAPFPGGGKKSPAFFLCCVT